MHIAVLPGVFRPRSDSWQLARVIADAVTPGSRALDLCTGSGVVAVSAARAGAEAWATDISRSSAWTARLNGRINGVRVRALTGELFTPVAGRRFDVISANPPYLPTSDGVRVPRSLARAIEGGPDGRAVLDRIIAGAPRHLRPGGRLFLIHSSYCDIDRTLDLLRAQGLRAEVVQRSTGPLGPLMSARASHLERAGVLEAGSRQEVMAVIRAVAPDSPADPPGSPSGTEDTMRRFDR